MVTVSPPGAALYHNHAPELKRWLHLMTMRNAIHNLDTKWFRNDAGEFLDEETAWSFLDHVIEQLKSQRMCSPPTTAHMTVTVAGNMSAERFRDLWAQRSAGDPILKHFMSMMVHADVLHIRGRELQDRASLIT